MCGPVGMIGSLDVGSIVEMSGAVGSRRSGLFWLPSDAKIDTDIYAVLGRGDCRDLTSDKRMIETWESVTGYRPAGDRLVDLAWDHMTGGADPMGDDGPYPLRPSRQGFLRLVFAGHSEVKRQAFTVAHPHWQKVRDAYKRILGNARERSLKGEFKNPLPDAAGKRHQVDREFHLGMAKAALEVLAASGVSDFDAICPNGWGKNEKPKPHGTTVTDNFNRSNQNALGSSSEGWGWSEASAGAWDIVSNQAACDTQNAVLYARCGTSLSGDGHYSQVVAATLTPFSTNSAILAAVARIGASMVNNHSRFQVDAIAASPAANTRKVVAGSTSTISGPTSVTVSGLPKLVYHRYDESDAYSSQWAGSEVHSGTDTSHQGATDVGMLAFEGVSSTVIADDFEAGDYAVATGHPWYYYAQQGAVQ